ncbi:MAG TPA: phosphatidate cytidylyltransferase [Gemmataceae bacterium]|nr:phosphatidate cytidylyltransferase [Gemmataceae bacterium]
MLRTRLWMGTLLIGLAVLIILEHEWFAPWYPFLFLCYVAATFFAARELLRLLPLEVRPNEPLTLAFVVLIALCNWLPAVRSVVAIPAGLDALYLIGAAVVVGMVAAFLREMWNFTGPNRCTERVALAAFILLYLGVLPSFFAQIRWLGDSLSTWALALAVFVPKGNDIGAYFTGKFLTGRVLGRHHMTPLLSPKKTWQGAVGGMLASVVVAVGINQFGSVIPGGWVGAIGFGLTVGLAGVLGDLAESLIKRDLETKDAATSIPGFGGVLDVVDSLLFAAPVACLWFRIA